MFFCRLEEKKNNRGKNQQKNEKITLIRYLL